MLATNVIVAVGMALLIVVAAVYDVWVFGLDNPDNRDTISAVILQTARRVPIILVLAGCLIGHLFWPQTIR